VNRERGQATVEWIALVLVAALIVLGLLAAVGGRVPGGELARAILGRMVCAVRLDGSCGDDGTAALLAAYGPELAAAVREHAPDLLYEKDMVALPVDYRRCRRPACSDGAETGLVTRSAAGEPVVGFVHVVDCRPAAAEEALEAGYHCSGKRSGGVYLQYFFYYPTSSTAKALPGKIGFHRDDWESFQVRLWPAGAWARASSHHGYNYKFSKLNGASDAGVEPVNGAIEAVGARPKGGWGPDTGQLHVSGGSHAGNAKREGYVPPRTTPGEGLVLIPIESLSDSDRAVSFEVVPPWRKPVYSDPESEKT
jgi:hypothetical protein